MLLGVTVTVGVTVGVFVGVTLGVAVDVAVGLALAVAVGVGVGVGLGDEADWAMYLPPVLTTTMLSFPPHTIISLPVQMAV